MKKKILTFISLAIALSCAVTCASAMEISPKESLIMVEPKGLQLSEHPAEQEEALLMVEPNMPLELLQEPPFPHIFEWFYINPKGK